MKALFQKICDTVRQGQNVALATVISSKGSLPMSKQAKMLVFQDSSIMGTVGGGSLEAQVIQEAQEVLLRSIPKIVQIDLTSEQIEADGLTCGGTVEIFIEPFTPETNVAVIDEIVQVYSHAQTAVIVTLLSPDDPQYFKEPIAFGGPNRKVVVHTDGSLLGTVGSESVDAKIAQLVCTRAGQSSPGTQILELSSHEAQALKVYPRTQCHIFLETLLPPPTAYLFGGGHISLHLSKMLDFIGFEYVVIDDRKEFLTSERFPEAKKFVWHKFEHVFDVLSLIPHSSYVIIVTRGHKSDLIVLEQAIRTNVKYIGMIGSQRKITLLFQRLQEQGIKKERLDRVHAPIGLDIEADTPEEIAISIAAELIKIRRMKIGN